MTEETVRVGVVGHGHFGGYHAKQYAAHPDAELVGIADPSDKAAEVINASYGNVHVRNYRDLIGSVDAVSIAAPTAFHEEIATAFIEAGVHLLVEKPLALTEDSAKRLSEMAMAAGVVLNVGHIERFSASYAHLKSKIAAPPLLYDAQRHAPWLGRILDVDVVLDMMIHDIDLVLDLAQSEPVDVRASGVEMMGHGLDSVLARVAFANGAVAHIGASRVAPTINRVMRVTEAARTLTVDFGTGAFSVFDAAANASSEVDLPHRDSLRAEIDAFLAAVRGDGAGGVTGDEATKALALADRIRAAAVESSGN